ncbi:MAG: chloride channel protein [Thermodesulfobacteriota bacterium]|nr:chloride channel protein [Thermodesulfobacteriota bacterium]
MGNFAKTDLISRFKANEYAVMILMAVIVGILGGYGAVGFRLLIKLFQTIFFGSDKGSFLELLLSLPWYMKLIPPIIGGALVGPIVYFFAREAKGHGVPEVMEAVALKGGIVRKRIVLIKPLASAICIGSGGSAGREGPIVQIGSAIGSAFGQIVGVSAERMRTLVGCGAAAGIAATFNAPIAGAMHGPFSAILILFEMTGDYKIILPLMLSCIISSVIAMHIKHGSIYTLKLIRRGVNIQSGKEVNIMKSLLVRDTMISKVETIPGDMPLRRLLEFTLSSRHSCFPVVDREGSLTGIVTFQDFKEIIFEESLRDLVVAKDLSVSDVITITQDENLDDALKKMGFKGKRQLMVVDRNDPRKIIGLLSRADIFAAYNKALVDRSLAGSIQGKGKSG